MKPGDGGAPGVQEETLRTLLLDLKQAIFNFVDELTERGIVGCTGGSFNCDELFEARRCCSSKGALGVPRSRMPVCPEDRLLNVISITQSAT